MNTTRVRQGLAHDNSSVRLQAALAAGTAPDPQLIEALVERCAVEPDFFVRDMLTWALTRHPSSGTVPRLIVELDSPRAQARSQALHSLSKIGDRSAWPAITRELLTDSDDEVARAAWRTAAGLVPAGAEPELASHLTTQLGRGDRETQLSLSRALITLGEVVLPLLADKANTADLAVRHHALATTHLFHDPEAGFEFAVDQAKRIVALGPDGPPGPTATATTPPPAPTAGSPSLAAPSAAPTGPAALLSPTAAPPGPAAPTATVTGRTTSAVAPPGPTAAVAVAGPAAPTAS